MKLGDKIIIVTGASKGLGVDMAKICAGEGAKVVCAARSTDELEAVASAINEAGRRAAFFQSPGQWPENGRSLEEMGRRFSSKEGNSLPP